MLTGRIQFKPNTASDFIDLDIPTLLRSRPTAGDSGTIRALIDSDDPLRIGDVAVLVQVQDSPAGSVPPIPVGTVNPSSTLQSDYTLPAGAIPFIDDNVLVTVFGKYLTPTGEKNITFDSGRLFFDDGDASFSLIQKGPADGGSVEAVLSASDPDDGIVDTPAPTFAWKVGGSPDSRSSTSSFPLNASDAGKSITLVVDYKDGEGFQETVGAGPLTVVGNTPTLSSGPVRESLFGFSKGANYLFDAFRDYDGILHGGAPASVADDYQFQGAAVPFNGIPTLGVFSNKESGRFATAAIDPISGLIDFSTFDANGATRVAGIYVDANKGTEFDGQARLTKDLQNQNLSLEAFGDFDGDGDTDLYWRTLDGTAFLRIILHSDGNTQYANYQNFAQMSSTLTGLGQGSLIPDIIA